MDHNFVALNVNGSQVRIEHIPGQQLWQQAASLRASFVHGPMTDQVLADLRYTSTGASEAAVMTLTDHQGTVRDFAAIDSAINSIVTVGHRDYDAFGNLRSSTYSTGSPSSSVAIAATAASNHLFAYTGREQTAEEGRYDYRMRSYDSRSGRFLQPDPLGLRAGDTNLYRYVGNDAVNYIDPLGLTEEPASQCSTVHKPAANAAERNSPGEPDCSCSCAAAVMSAQAEDAENTRTGSTPNSPGTEASPDSAAGLIPSAPTTQRDAPVGFAAGETNSFGYAGNGPTTKTDPSGLEPPSTSPIGLPPGASTDAGPIPLDRGGLPITGSAMRLGTPQKPDTTKKYLLIGFNYEGPNDFGPSVGRAYTQAFCDDQIILDAGAGAPPADWQKAMREARNLGQYDVIIFVAHGSPRKSTQGGDVGTIGIHDLRDPTRPEYKFLQELSKHLKVDGETWLRTCYTARGTDGREFIWRMQKILGGTVFANDGLWAVFPWGNPWKASGGPNVTTRTSDSESGTYPGIPNMPDFPLP